MCGIAGILSEDISINSESIVPIVENMVALLSHRGPDSSGLKYDNPAYFGHRRLSILDPSPAGSQPMSLDGRGLMITYNGEIYNFRELRTEIDSLSSLRWNSRSDTEVILRCYLQWGLDGLKKLEGIFSFALWDATRNRLVLMRDRLGVKPLFYANSKHGLAFGSEIKAVLAAHDVDASLDDQAFSEYLWYGNSYGDRTFFSGVRALEPGQWLVLENGNRYLEYWWRVEEWLNTPLASRNLPEAAQQVQVALDQAVTRQLVADVPVGTFLSGGVDSSAIAAAAVASCTHPISSYAAGFDFDAGINELPKAALVARHLGLDHHELLITSGDLVEALQNLVRAHDEPFADAANIALYLMCNQLHEKIKVVMQGDGGDELFAGYRRYAVLRNSRLWRLMPQSFSSRISSFGHFGRRFARLAYSVGNSDPALRMAYLLTVETPQDPPEALLSPDRRRELSETTDPFLAYRHAAERFRHFDPVDQMLLTDLTVQLPSQFLTKVDRATMAAGIEARVPFLDEIVVRLAITLPSQWKAKGLGKKIVLRQSQRGRVPDAVLDTPKTGFGVPYDHWLRTSLFDFAQSHLLDSGFIRRFSLDSSTVARMLSAHRQSSGNKGFMLWKLLQLALWHSSYSSLTKPNP